MKDGILSLTGNADPKRPDSNEVVTVRTGVAPDYTNVYLGGALFMKFGQPLLSIEFDGSTGDDSLAFFGKNPEITINLIDVERVEINSLNMTVTSNDSLLISGATVVGTLNVSTAAGDITQSGRMSVSDTMTLSANDGEGDITLTASGNTFGTLQLNGANVTVVEASATDLGASTVTDLTVRSGAAITDSDQLVVAGNLSLAANNNSITIDNETSTFGGLISLKGTSISLADSDENGVDLGTVSAKGTLNVTSASAIIHSEGVINVTGQATFTANNGVGDITLTTGDNSFGSLSLFGGNVTIAEKGATDFSQSTVTNLTASSTGTITDSGAITVAETTTLTAIGRAITLDHPESKYSGLLTLTGANTLVVNNTATILGAITTSSGFILNSAGDVTQPDNSTNTVGRATINATDFDVTLGKGSRFGSLSLVGRNVTIDEANPTNLFTSSISGDFNLTTNGAVTDNGTILVEGTTSIYAGTGTITLDTPDSSYSGTLSLTSSNVTLLNITDTDFGPTIVSRNLRVVSTGNVTQTGSLRVSGRATFSAVDQDITLADAGNAFGSIAFVGNNVELIERDSTNLFTSNIAGSLSVTSSGAITDSGFLTIGGMSEFRSTSHITLDAASSVYGGTLILVGLSIKLDSNSALDLGFVHAAGTLTITSRHDITDSNPTEVAEPDPVLSATGTVRIYTPGILMLDEIRTFLSANVTLRGDAGTFV